MRVIDYPKEIENEIALWDKHSMVLKLMFSVTGKCRVRITHHGKGCWEWKGAMSPQGYGKVGFGPSVIQAHRLSYIAFFGPVPPGMDLDHLCRNRGCVNPWHMEPVSRAINARRGLRTKLTQANVDEIRRRYKEGGITQATLGKEFGVGNDVVCEIVNYKIWRDAPSG